jgi:hypothetical protein
MGKRNDFLKQSDQNNERAVSKESKGFDENSCLPNSSSEKITEFSTEPNHSESAVKLQDVSSENQSYACPSVNGNENEEIEVSLPKPFKMSSRKNTKRSCTSNAKSVESCYGSEEFLGPSGNCIQLLVANICKQI